MEIIFSNFSIMSYDAGSPFEGCNGLIAPLDFLGRPKLHPSILRRSLKSPYRFVEIRISSDDPVIVLRQEVEIKDGNTYFEIGRYLS